jgi:nickel-dependent lactate racemase
MVRRLATAATTMPRYREYQMKKLTLPQLPMEGPKELEIELPDEWDVRIQNMNGHARPAVTDDQITGCLRKPLGTLPLGELAKGKKEVVIIFDDYTRGMKWHDIAQLVLAELHSAGIGDHQIRFMCALGTHGSANRTQMVQKLGEEIVSRYPVYNHNAFSMDNVHLGRTKTWDIDVNVNPEVMACDLKLALGAVTPHPINGFGGGSKIVLPGICAYQTVVDHHLKSFKIAFDAMNKAAESGTASKIGLGIYDPKERPAIDVDDEAAALVGLDFTINVVANGRGQAVGIWGGDVGEVFVEALTDGKKNYATEPAEDADIVIANAFYKVNEPMIALLPMGPTLKKSGGTGVLVSNMPEGLTMHYFQGLWGLSPAGRAPHSNAVNLSKNIEQLLIYNEYPHPGSEWWIEPKEKISRYTNWNQIVTRLKELHPGSPTVAVYPNADFQFLSPDAGKYMHHDIFPPH